MTVLAVVLLASCGGETGNEQAVEGGNAAATSAAAVGDTSSGANGSTGGAGLQAGQDPAGLQPGQWEITTTVLNLQVRNMPPGMSRSNQAPNTMRTCLTAAEASAPSGGFLTGTGEGASCSTRNLSVSGGRIEGVVQCNQEGSTMRSTLEGRFSETSFEVNQHLVTSAQGMTMTLEGRTNGRRIGDCTR